MYACWIAFNRAWISFSDRIWAYQEGKVTGGKDVQALSRSDVLDKMNAAIASWQAIDPTLKFGDLSLDMMQSALEQGQAPRNRIKTLEIQLTDLRDRRDAVYHTGSQYINRLRDGIMSRYGEDSSEYEMVGQTRLSERKPRSKRVKPVVSLNPSSVFYFVTCQVIMTESGVIVTD